MSARAIIAAASIAFLSLTAAERAAQAEIITVTDDVSLNGQTGTFQFSYDTTETGTDADGSYADPSHGLLSFNLDIGSNDFTMSEIYDLSATLPVVLLPGNSNLNADAPGGYSAEGNWYDTSTGVVFGVGRIIPVFEATGVVAIDYSGTGSTTEAEDDHYGPITAGVLSVADIEVPEPASLAVFGAGLVGLAAIRRRKRQ